MYKDKDKDRQRASRNVFTKLAVKGVTEHEKGMTNQGMTVSGSSTCVIPCDTRLKVIPEDTPIVILCEAGSERGKDIKVFEDLPPDVQQTIDIMSVVDGKIDKTIKVNRTAIAVHYQHLFPDRCYSTGVA